MEEQVKTIAGRTLVAPFPPQSQLPIPAPKPDEPPPLAVFNRSGRTQGFSFPPYPYTEIPAGKWTLEDSAHRPIPRTFTLNYLRNNPDFNVQIPYEYFFANDDTHLTVAACIDQLTGWGTCNSHIVEQLARLRGEEVQEETWNPPPANKSDLVLYPTTYWHYDTAAPIIRQLMRRAYHATKWGLALTIPTEIANIPVKNLILMSMWETGSLPKEWAQDLKRVKHLIVPSQSQVEIFRQGYAGDISVIPLGVDTETFTYRPRPPRDADAPFTILLYGSPLSSRKSPIETITEVCYKAFSGAFGEPVTNWKLILKTHSNIVGTGKFGLVVNDSHVEIISRVMTKEELADLCYQSDVGVMLSKFEGFGLPFREMMATGLPVIVSKNTGHIEDCNDWLNFPVPTRRIIPAQEAYSGDEDWKWCEPDYDTAAELLREQYELWKLRGRTQSVIGQHAAEYIQENRTWKHTATAINNLVQQIRQTN